MRPCGWLVVAVCGVVVCPVLAQTVERGVDGTTRTFVPGVEILPVTGIPLVGKDTVVWTRPMDGGGSTTVSVDANLARDSQGRVYRERHHFAPADVDPKKTLYESYVVDPVSGMETVCEYATRRCTVTKYRPRPVVVRLQPVGPFEQGKRYLARESLGTKTIDGLNVTGTMETLTILPGTIGNDRQLVSTREFWYSEELKTNVAVTRKDPREGTQVVTLMVYSRSEPDPQIFAVPAGFTVVYSSQPAIR